MENRNYTLNVISTAYILRVLSFCKHSFESNFVTNMLTFGHWLRLGCWAIACHLSWQEPIMHSNNATSETCSIGPNSSKASRICLDNTQRTVDDQAFVKFSSPWETKLTGQRQMEHDGRQRKLEFRNIKAQTEPLETREKSFGELSRMGRHKKTADDLQWEQEQRTAESTIW